MELVWGQFCSGTVHGLSDVGLHPCFGNNFCGARSRYTFLYSAVVKLLKIPLFFFFVFGLQVQCVVFFFSSLTQICVTYGQVWCKLCKLCKARRKYRKQSSVGSKPGRATVLIVVVVSVDGVAHSVVVLRYTLFPRGTKPDFEQPPPPLPLVAPPHPAPHHPV